MSNANWFCTLDLASGYHQVPMKESDKIKTAFSTRKGLKQFSVLPFGLCSAPSTFQKLMERVLNGLQWDKVLLYLDDVICFAKDFESMKTVLKLVLDRFRQSNLKLKPSKCKLFQISVEFLGHIVSRDGISCDPKKIEAVKNWPRPTNIRELRSFMGFAQYHRKFISHFATLCAPLYRLTKKNTKFHWSEDCEKAFVILKEKLTSTPVLAYPNETDTFILDTDASLWAAGAVLSQLQNGQEKVIAFGSKAFSEAQKKELLRYYA